jgi:hypothetical protein
LVLELAMSKAAHVQPSLIASSASAQKFEVTALDPAVLFSGICLLVLVLALVFGETGIWL